MPCSILPRRFDDITMIKGANDEALKAVIDEGNSKCQDANLAVMNGQLIITPKAGGSPTTHAIKGIQASELNQIHRLGNSIRRLYVVKLIAMVAGAILLTVGLVMAIPGLIVGGGVGVAFGLSIWYAKSVTQHLQQRLITEYRNNALSRAKSSIQLTLARSTAAAVAAPVAPPVVLPVATPVAAPVAVPVAAVTIAIVPAVAPTPESDLERKLRMVREESAKAMREVQSLFEGEHIKGLGVDQINDLLRVLFQQDHTKRTPFDRMNEQDKKALFIHFSDEQFIHLDYSIFPKPNLEWIVSNIFVESTVGGRLAKATPLGTRIVPQFPLHTQLFLSNQLEYYAYPEPLYSYLSTLDSFYLSQNVPKLAIARINPSISKIADLSFFKLLTMEQLQKFDWSQADHKIIDSIFDNTPPLLPEKMITIAERIQSIVPLGATGRGQTLLDYRNLSAKEAHDQLETLPPTAFLLMSITELQKLNPLVLPTKILELLEMDSKRFAELRIFADQINRIPVEAIVPKTLSYNIIGLHTLDLTRLSPELLTIVWRKPQLLSDAQIIYSIPKLNDLSLLSGLTEAQVRRIDFDRFPSGRFPGLMYLIPKLDRRGIEKLLPKFTFGPEEWRAIPPRSAFAIDYHALRNGNEIFKIIFSCGDGESGARKIFKCLDHHNETQIEKLYALSPWFTEEHLNEISLNPALARALDPAKLKVPGMDPEEIINIYNN